VTSPSVIADLIGQALTTNSGPEDVAIHTGQIQSWDTQSGVNAVMVNGVILTNLKSIQGGLAVSYTAGDTVMLVRKQTQYFILGKVTAPGGSAGSAIQSQRVASLQTVTSTSFGDLAGSFGPEVSVYIGSSRRCLVIHSVEITISNNPAGGWQAVQVSGASSIAVETGVTDAYWSGPGSTDGTFSATCLVTEFNGLRTGLNTFTCKYKKTGTGTVQVNNRVLTVIPL
jgi:hypothetical protein